jgi:hypothetical protein
MEQKIGLQVTDNLEGNTESNAISKQIHQPNIKKEISEKRENPKYT